jgi:hypothetical protein
VGFDWPAAPPGAIITNPKQNITAAKLIFKADEARSIFFPPNLQGRASYLLHASARINCFRNGKPTRVQTDAPR